MYRIEILFLDGWIQLITQRRRNKAETPVNQANVISNIPFVISFILLSKKTNKKCNVANKKYRILKMINENKLGL